MRVRIQVDVEMLPDQVTERLQEYLIDERPVTLLFEEDEARPLVGRFSGAREVVGAGS